MDADRWPDLSISEIDSGLRARSEITFQRLPPAHARDHQRRHGAAISSPDIRDAITKHDATGDGVTPLITPIAIANRLASYF